MTEEEEKQELEALWREFCMMLEGHPNIRLELRGFYCVQKDRQNYLRVLSFSKKDLSAGALCEEAGH